MSTCMTFFGEWSNSLPLGFVAGKANMDVRLDYMTPVIDGMEAAFLDELYGRISANVTIAGGNSFRGEMFPQIIANITLTDLEGDRFIVEGANWRLIDQCIYGESYPDELNLGPGTFTVEHWLIVPVRPDRAYVKPDQCRWPAKSFSKGKCKVSWSGTTVGTAPNIATINAATFFELHSVIVDEFEVKDEKVRLYFADKVITASEDEYPVGNIRLLGAGLYFGVGNQNAAAGVNPWPTQTITSKNFGWSQLTDVALQRQYRMRRQMRTQDAGAVATVCDEVLKGTMLPLITPRIAQKMTECPQVNSTWNIKTSLPFGAGNFTSVNAPRLVYYGFVDRPSDTCSSNHKVDAVPGPVVDLMGNPKDPATVAVTLRNKLPRVLIPTGATRKP
jgi:hypothetical protein